MNTVTDFAAYRHRAVVLAHVRWLHVCIQEVEGWPFTEADVTRMVRIVEQSLADGERSEFLDAIRTELASAASQEAAR